MTPRNVSLVARGAYVLPEVCHTLFSVHFRQILYQQEKKRQGRVSETSWRFTQERMDFMVDHHVCTELEKEAKNSATTHSQSVSLKHNIWQHNQTNPYEAAPPIPSWPDTADAVPRTLHS